MHRAPGVVGVVVDIFEVEPVADEGTDLDVLDLGGRVDAGHAHEIDQLGRAG